MIVIITDVSTRQHCYSCSQYGTYMHTRRSTSSFAVATNGSAWSWIRHCHGFQLRLGQLVHKGIRLSQRNCLFYTTLLTTALTPRHVYEGIRVGYTRVWSGILYTGVYHHRLWYITYLFHDLRVRANMR